MSDKQNASTKNEASTPLKIAAYRENVANIRSLHQTLPEQFVINLAREVIYRIATKQPALVQTPYTVSNRDLDVFCDALLSKDETAAAEIVATLHTDGVAPEDIYLQHLAAAAQRFGDMWIDDTATFAQVTLGTGRIFAIMRSMRHLFEPQEQTQGKMAVFASVPGEDHTLGIQMATDIFRRNGWDIDLKIGLEHDQLVTEIEQSDASIVGLSVNGNHSMEALSRLVVALHICRPQAKIIVCGSNLDDIIPILSLMGLDGIYADIDDALAQISALSDAGAAH